MPEPSLGARQPPGEQPPRPRTGLASASGEEFSLQQAIGGPRGVAESVGPPLLFIVVFTLTRDLTWSLVAALVAGVLAMLVRLLTRDNPTQAISGLLGIVLCAAVSARTGEARDFFLPGFAINAAYGLAFLLTLMPLPALTVGGVRRRPGPYPLLGLVLGPLTGEGLGWRDDPRRRRVYLRLTVAWGLFFLAKLVVQVPLYLTEQVGALGVAKLALGVPAYAFMCWLTWLVLRRRPDAPDAAPAD